MTDIMIQKETPSTNGLFLGGSRGECQLSLACSILRFSIMAEGTSGMGDMTAQKPARATEFTYALIPDLGALSGARRFVADTVAGSGLSEERIYDLKLAVSEACANAIEHGRPGADLKLTVRLLRDRIEADVFALSDFEMPSMAKVERDSHRGMGLPLMAALSDHLALYSHPAGGTLVTLTFYYKRENREAEPDQPFPPAQAELLEERILLTSVVENAPVGIYVLDADLRFRWANRAYQAFLEPPYRSCDLTGLSVAEVVSSDGRGPNGAEPEILRILRRVSQTGEPFMGDEHVFKGFSRGATYWKWQALALPNGAPPHAVMVLISEITEQVQSRRRVEELAREALLRGQEAKQQGRLVEALLASVSQAIVIAGAPGPDVLMVSECALELTGGRLAGLKGAGEREQAEIWQLYDSDGSTLVPAERLPLARAIRSGEPVEADELLIRDGQGRLMPVLCSTRLVRDEAGTITWAVLSLEQVEERRRLELDLTRARRRAENLARVSQRVSDLNHALHEINLLINSKLKRDEILQRVIEAGTGIIGAEGGVVALHEEGFWRVTNVTRPDWAPLIGRAYRTEEIYTLRTVFEAGQPLVIRDFRKVAEANQALGKSPGIKSALTAPVFVGGEVQGVLSFQNHVGGGGFREEEVDFAEALAASVSVALENVRLYQVQRSISEELQSALLSSPEPVPGLRMQQFYRSASEAAHIGGDFYDVFPLSSNRAGLVIGDVSGHGVEAAATAAAVKDTLRAYAYQLASPSTILTRSNRALQRRPGFAGFVTVFLAILDLDDGRLAYSSAGHPPPFHRVADGQVGLLEGSDPPLGVFEDTRYRTHRSSLGVGDLVLLYTDGLTECRQGAAFFGENRIRQLLAAFGEPDVRELPAFIFDGAARFCGNSFHDDLALLTLQLERRQK